MPGMNSGPGPGSPILVSAFRSALLQQWLIVALIFTVLLIAWGGTRTAVYGPAPGKSLAAARPWREPRARRLLRVGFGVLWLFDGLLQAQPQMAGGLADQVIRPSATSSPGWVRQLVDFGVTVWDYHPVQAAAAAVWIQIGIGLWMIIAVRGRSARLASVAALLPLLPLPPITTDSPARANRFANPVPSGPVPPKIAILRVILFLSVRRLYAGRRVAR